MSQQVELIVFDMAGTTIRDKNEVEQCFFEAIRKTELDATHDEINAMMGWSKITVFETLWRKKLIGESEERIREKIQQSFLVFKTILENYYRTMPVVPAEGAEEIFEFLRVQGIKIALTTGFYREVTDIILNRLGWDAGLDSNYAGNGIINASVSSDQVRFARPAPFMVFRAMELCGVADVRKVIKIGDTPSDLGEGIHAGCLLSCGVTNGTHTRAQLLTHPHDVLFGSLKEFHEFLSKQICSNH